MILNSTRNVQPASEGGGVDLDHDRHSGAFEFDIGVGPPDPIQVVMGISVSKSLTQTTDAPTDCSEPQYYVVHLCGETVRSNPEFDPIRASWRSRCHDACVDSIKSGGHKSGIVIHRLSVSISFMRMQLQTVFWCAILSELWQHLLRLRNSQFLSRNHAQESHGYRLQCSCD